MSEVVVESSITSLMTNCTIANRMPSMIAATRRIQKPPYSLDSVGTYALPVYAMSVLPTDPLRPCPMWHRLLDHINDFGWSRNGRRGTRAQRFRRFETIGGNTLSSFL